MILFIAIFSLIALIFLFLGITKSIIELRRDDIVKKRTGIYLGLGILLSFASLFLLQFQQ